MLHLNPNVKGRWIKLGNLGWQRLKDIDRAEKGRDTGKDVLLVHLKRGGAPMIYRGNQIENCKKVLDEEAGR